MRALAYSACALACSFGLPHPAKAAATKQIELRWRAPHDCSSAADVLRSVDAQLGADFDSDTRLSATGEIRVRDGGEYELELSFTSASEAHDERQIRGESCAAVTGAAALVLALALDPRRSSEQPTPPEQPKSEVSAADSSRSSHISAGLLALLDTPILAGPAFGGGLRLGWTLGSFEWSASVQYFVPQDRAKADITMHLQLWSVDVGVCYLSRIAAVSVGPCARFEIGRLAGDPRGDIAEPSPGSERVHAATFGVAVRLPLSAAIGLAFDAGLEWVARRPQFEVDGVGTIASPAPFGARLAFGPMLTF